MIRLLVFCWEYSQQTDYAVIRLQTDLFIQQTPGHCLSWSHSSPPNSLPSSSSPCPPRWRQQQPRTARQWAAQALMLSASFRSNILESLTTVARFMETQNQKRSHGVRQRWIRTDCMLRTAMDTVVKNALKKTAGKDVLFQVGNILYSNQRLQ